MRVFKQLPPVPTGKTFQSVDAKGEIHFLEWHEARFKYVGDAKTWEEAKRLTPHPVVEGWVEK